MIIAGNKQRACMGGWLLAALLMLGINANQLMSLANQPLVGYSQTIKSLKTRLQQFDNTLVDGVVAFASQIELPQPSRVEKSLPAAAGPDPKGPQDQTSKQPTVLPSLTGIMHVVSPDGDVYFQAVLNGRVCREKDKIDNFSIVKISPAGVVIRRAGFQWTIDSPNPHYSSDQGE